MAYPPTRWRGLTILLELEKKSRAMRLMEMMRLRSRMRVRNGEQWSKRWTIVVEYVHFTRRSNVLKGVAHLRA